MKDELRTIYAQWQEAREVTEVLRETCAAMIRGKRLYLQAASLVGVKSQQANTLHSELVVAAQKEYFDAFTRECELSDTYTALKIGIPVPPNRTRR